MIGGLVLIIAGVIMVFVGSFCYGYNEGYRDGVNMTCDDAISRSDAIKVVNDMLLGELDCKEEALKKMKRLSSVNSMSR